MYSLFIGSFIYWGMVGIKIKSILQLDTRLWYLIYYKEIYKIWCFTTVCWSICWVTRWIDHKSGFQNCLYNFFPLNTPIGSPINIFSIKVSTHNEPRIMFRYKVLINTVLNWVRGKAVYRCYQQFLNHVSEVSWAMVAWNSSVLTFSSS